MKTELEIFAVVVIIYVLLGLASYIDQKRSFIIIFSISIAICALGLIIRTKEVKFTIQLLFIPIIETTLIKLSHLAFRYFENEPFYVNLRGKEYPEHLKSNRNGFTRFLNSLVSFFIILVTLLLYFLMKG